MQSFKLGGQTFQVDVNPVMLRRVKALTEVELFDLFDADSDTGKRLQRDLPLMVDVLYAAVKPQCDALGWTDEQFGSQFTSGDVIAAASSALIEALVSFFQTARQAPWRAAIKAIQERDAVLDSKMEQIAEAVGRTAAERLRKELDRLDAATLPPAPGS